MNNIRWTGMARPVRVHSREWPLRRLLDVREIFSNENALCEDLYRMNEQLEWMDGDRESVSESGKNKRFEILFEGSCDCDVTEAVDAAQTLLSLTVLLTPNTKELRQKLKVAVSCIIQVLMRTDYNFYDLGPTTAPHVKRAAVAFANVRLIDYMNRLMRFIDSPATISAPDQHIKPSMEELGDDYRTGDECMEYIPETHPDFAHAVWDIKIRKDSYKFIEELDANQFVGEVQFSRSNMDFVKFVVYVGGILTHINSLKMTHVQDGLDRATNAAHELVNATAVTQKAKATRFLQTYKQHGCLNFCRLWGDPKGQSGLYDLFDELYKTVNGISLGLRDRKPKDIIAANLVEFSSAVKKGMETCKREWTWPVQTDPSSDSDAPFNPPSEGEAEYEEENKKKRWAAKQRRFQLTVLKPQENAKHAHDKALHFEPMYKKTKKSDS